MYKSFFLAAFALALAVPAAAQTTASHVVTVEVATVRAIEVGADLTLSAVAPSPGDADLRYTGASTYGVITNASGDVVTVEVTNTPAAGLTLEADYAAPSGATGGTDYVLNGTPQNVVTGISNVSASGLSIGYEAIATLSLAPGTYDFDLTYTIKTP